MNRLRLLIGSLCVIANACGGTSPGAVAPPGGVTATASDQRVTVQWNAVAGATGYVVYYNLASQALGKSSPHQAAATTSADVTGLTDGTAYQFAVTAANAGGESALSATVTATPQAPLAPLSAVIAPTDGATAVKRRGSIQVTFNRAVPSGAVTVLSSGTVCDAASVQLSADGFATCLPMAAPTSTDNAAFTLAPAAPLAAATKYKLRLTTATGLAQAATTSFTTRAAMAVSSTSPAPGATAVAVGAAIAVTFSAPATASSITASASGSACSGAVQLSSDSFATCVPLGAASNAGQTFSFQPAAALAEGVAYAIRVTTAALDDESLPLAAQFEAAPFTTAANPLLLVSATPADGDTGVPLNGPIVLHFNHAVDATTVTAKGDCTGTVRVPQGGGYCNGFKLTANTAGDVITLTVPPGGDFLAPDTQYTLAVTSGIKDAAGRALSNPLSQSTGFHTRLKTVLTVTPADGASGVPINSAISFGFSRAVTGVVANTTSGCDGTVGVVNGFAGCVAIASVSHVGNVYTLHPTASLPPHSTLVAHALSGIVDAVDGVAIDDFVQPHGFATGDELFVSSTSPSDGDGAVALNAKISVTFNRAPALATLKAGVDTNCDKAVQLSTDPNFVDGSCLPMSSADPTDLGSFEYQWTPKTLFDGGAQLYLRVVAALVTDADGVPLRADFGGGAGFTVKDALAVSSTTPAENATEVPLTQAKVFIVFNRPVTATSITTDGDGACSASVQISDDSFVSCLKLGTPAVTDGDVVIPVSALLDGSKTYLIKLDGVLDEDGAALPTWFSSPGFQTKAPLAVVAGATTSGNDLPLDVQPVVTFTRAAANVGSDCSGGSVFLRTAAGACVASTIASSDGGVTWTITPGSSLLANADYLIVVTTAVTDADGAPLAAQFTQGFHTQNGAPLHAGITPNDGATAVPRTTGIDLTFTRAINAATVTADCTSGNVRVLDGATCIPATVSTADNPIVHLSFASPLPGAALIQVRVTAGVLAADGVAATDATSAGFTTSLLTVSSTPADGAGPVAIATPITVVFSEQPKNVVTGCTSAATVTLAADAKCVDLGDAAVSSDGLTFVYEPVLAASTSYQLTVTTGVTDAQNVPLDSAHTASFVTADLPSNVTDLKVTTSRLQSLELGWTVAQPTDFTHANIYVRPAGGGGKFTLVDSGTETGGTLSGLLPFKPYDVIVTAVNSFGDETTGTELDNQSTGFSGAAADWLGPQTIADAGSNKFRLSWTDTDLVAGISAPDDANLLSPGDALWIAVDTDPAGDANGEVRTQTVAGSEIIWPFKADYVIELKMADTGAHVNLRTAAGGGSWANDVASDSSSGGGVREVRIGKSLLGSPAQARFAMAAVNTTNGFTFAVAPANVQATNTAGHLASLTAGLDSGTNAFSNSTTRTSLDASVTQVVQAPALVTLSVSSLNAVTFINGSVHPLSYDPTQVSYTLSTSGFAPARAVGPTTYSGRFNFGGSKEELFFQFAGTSGVEFPNGIDRVWTLGGATEALPTVAFGTPLGAPCTLTFVPSPGSGVTPADFHYGRSDSDPQWSVAEPISTPLDFGTCNFTSTPLQFKATNGSGTWEGVGNHFLDDDILNARTLSWTWDTSPAF